jgi:hypothetical protein
MDRRGPADTLGDVIDEAWILPLPDRLPGWASQRCFGRARFVGQGVAMDEKFYQELDRKLLAALPWYLKPLGWVLAKKEARQRRRRNEQFDCEWEARSPQEHEAASKEVWEKLRTFRKGEMKSSAKQSPLRDGAAAVGGNFGNRATDW